MNICEKSRMRAGCRSGFTLIELLVVIAIISILITMLVPSIGRAISTAQKVKCASNMRNMGQAWAMYAAEHQGKLVGSMTDNPNKDWLIFHPNMAWNKEKKIEGIKMGLLWQYLNDLDVYRCPGTYGFMKEYVSNYSFSIIVGAPHKFSRWHNMSQIQFPGETLLMVEDFDWRYGNWGGWGFQRQGWYSWWDYLPGNHMGGDNFLFCDGHVEYRKYEDPETLSVYDVRHFGRRDPDGVNPDIDWIGRRYKHSKFYAIDGRLREKYKNNPPWN